MKLAITTGGGGHFAPALAIIENLPKQWQVFVIGRKYSLEGDGVFSLEYKTAQGRGIAFYAITAGRIQRTFTRYTIPSLFKIPIGFWQSLYILKKEKPTVLLSFGGYVSVPVVLAAFILRVPVVIHEQTLKIGLSNKLASFFARKICVSWEQSKNYFPKEKTVVTGNPIRTQLLVPKPVNTLFKEYRDFFKEEKPYIYITGGSIGSHAINVLVEENIRLLLSKFRIFHQTGGAEEYKDYQRLSSLREELDQKLTERYCVTRFVNPSDVGTILQHASLVVGRSGINTVSELLLFKKPSFLIPLPYSQNKEQYDNAHFLKKLGLAEVRDQRSLSRYEFLEVIEKMMGNPTRYILSKDSNFMFEEIVKNASGNLLQVIKEIQD